MSRWRMILSFWAIFYQKDLNPHGNIKLGGGAMVKTLEEIGEEASNLIADITAKAEIEELDNKMVASFVDRNAHLIKDMAEAIALMQERVDVISLKP
jgi:hypothetical protein